MNIRDVTQEGTVLPVEEEKPMVTQANVTGPALPEIELRAVAQSMGLEKESEIHYHQDKLNTLLDYAKSMTDDHSPEGLKWALRKLELRIGTPPFGEKKLAYLTRYAYLELEERQIQKEKMQFEEAKWQTH